MADLPPGFRIVNERVEDGSITFTLEISDPALYEAYLHGTVDRHKSLTTPTENHADTTRRNPGDARGA